MEDVVKGDKTKNKWNKKKGHEKEKFKTEMSHRIQTGESH